MKKINEIFHSLQGEGRNTGISATFVRFSGCNLKCPFCDTLHDEGSMMTDDEICAEVAKYPARLVVLTGGEPSLWVDAPLISRLHAMGKTIAIETNGTNPLPDGIDWITLSPKIGMSSGGDKLRLEYADEIKVVYTGKKNTDSQEIQKPHEIPESQEVCYSQENTDSLNSRENQKNSGQDLEKYFSLPQRREHTLMYLQPCYVEDSAERAKILQATIEQVMADPRWRLSLQTHRLLKIR